MTDEDEASKKKKKKIKKNDSAEANIVEAENGCDVVARVQGRALNNKGRRVRRAPQEPARTDGAGVTVCARRASCAAAVGGACSWAVS